MLHPDELALVKDRKECDHTEEYLDIRLQNKYLPRSIHEAQDAPPEGQPRLYWINSSGYARCPLTCIEPAAYKESPMPKFHVQLLYDVYAYMQYFRLYHRDVPYLYEPICIELVYCDYKQSVENMMAGLSLTSNGPPLDACPHPIEISLYRRPLKERRVFKKKPVDDDPFAGDILSG
ncbi:hypothetical protein EUX98_g3153 [Antrodiella citrinella]|uniref:Uncharacterized protein n=1 Tax=Antrodiella citrinella TaxID=2447956 RepID=A0A4S4MX81_9APHY|nr:hypothetical protein EUX98_g3153 [Antrodiella citrinella]